MTTKTINRVNRVSRKTANKCSWRGCEASFPTQQGLAMHVGRKHTKTIPNAWSKKAKEKVPQIHVDGSVSNGQAKRKYTKRATSWNKTPVAAPINCIGSLSSKELQRVSKLYLRASKLRRKLEQVLMA